MRQVPIRAMADMVYSHEGVEAWRTIDFEVYSQVRRETHVYLYLGGVFGLIEEEICQRDEADQHQWLF